MISDTIPFDPRRFRTAAAHYLSGRPAYAPALFARVAAICGLQRDHAVLDLGCGPGQLALGFAPFVATVTAIDPEPEMLRIAAEQAAAAGAAIRFVQGSSYDIEPELGRFRLATIGRAFHWMDRADTLARLDRMIDPEGAVALFADRHPEVPDNRWRQTYDALLDRYSAPDTARAQRKSPDWPRHETMLLDSAFCRLERVSVIERRRTPVDQIVSRMLSLSSVSHAQIGAKADVLAQELRTAIGEFAQDGAIAEVVESEALIARRDV
jgi:SAM-dependent methyltransferase